MTFSPLIQETDFRILDWIQANLRTGWTDWLMPKVTSLGNAGIFWILLTAVFLLWKPHRRCGVAMLLALAGCLLAGNIVLKNLVARARPCWINTGIDMLVAVPGDYSFPSGHTYSGVAVGSVLLSHDRRIGIPALLLAALIAFSRLYVYVHFPTDVLAGALLGILMEVLAQKLEKLLWNQFHQTAGKEEKQDV